MTEPFARRPPKENTLKARTDELVNVRSAETPEAAEDDHGMAALKKKRKRGGKVEGDAPRMRMDRRASGGKVNAKKGTTVNILIGGPKTAPTPVPVPAGPPPGMPAPMPRPPMPMGAPGTPMPGGMPAPGAAGPMGVQPLPGAVNPLGARKHGGRVGRDDGGSVNSRNRSKNEGDFRQLTDTDFGDSPAYRGNPATKMTNTGIGNIRGGDSEKLIGVNDPRPADPRQASDALMERMQDDSKKRGGSVKRADGGSVKYPLRDGSGSGEGRLQKERAYGKKAYD